jgi:NADP-dependent 3-hydroxy acid dehydrogenase YdfG
MYRLDDKVFVVTGGAGALARPILQRLARAGAGIVVVDRDENATKLAAGGVDGIAIAADLSTLQGAQSMADAAIAAMGRIDGLIHTVGGFGMGRVHEVDPSQYDRMFDVNMRTLFYAVRAVLGPMIARKEGFIAAIGAAPARNGSGPGMSLYAAAKSAVAAFLRSLDGELAGTNIATALVHPMGAIDTPANRRDMPELDAARFVDPAEIAEALVFAATRGPRGRLSEIAIYPAR